MNRLETALFVLTQKGINAKIENDTIYVTIQDCELEISDFEIDFQVSEYDSFK